MQTAERISGLILLLGALAIPFGLVGFSIVRDSQPAVLQSTRTATN
jgi:hypothetical protein